jgi:predicted Ser/Thr protein kinase
VAAPTTILRSGEVLGGYRVGDLLGVGGMAVVYRAHQLSLNRPVALKVLSRDVTHDDSFRERFRREAHHAATLEHPNIVPVYDTGEDAGHLYIAMRLVEGGTLADLLQGGGLSPAGTVRILRPLAGALDAAHGLGLVHRDIKPENILLARDEHPYLGDFGVAKSNETRGLTEAGGFVGTVNYASPEQIRAEPLTSASDIYSFTAMAFECLTGQVPYPKETDAGVMQAHLVEPPPAIAVEGLAAATGLQGVIARGMAKEPGRRYGSATELIDAVEAAVATLPEADRRRRAMFGGGGVADGAAPMPVPVPARGATRLVPRRIEVPGASAADAAAQARARLKRRGTLAAVVAVAITLPLVAALRPSGGGGVQGPRVADGSFVAVKYAPPWAAQTAASPPLPGLDIDRPAALATAGPAGDAAIVRAGRLLRPSPVSAGLPAGVVQRFADGRPRPVTVRVGGVVARRYDGVLTDARRLSLLVVATDRGDLAVACERPLAGPLPARLCDGILGSLRLVGARALAPGPDPQLARGLDAALGPLAGARSQAALDDTSLVRRADNLRRLAAATTAAAASIRALTPRAADRPAVTRARAALDAEAQALGSLADATLDRLRAAYGTASAQVEMAQHRLRDALRELGRRGYRFTATALP